MKKFAELFKEHVYAGGAADDAPERMSLADELAAINKTKVHTDPKTERQDNQWTGGNDQMKWKAADLDQLDDEEDDSDVEDEVDDIKEDEYEVFDEQPLTEAEMEALIEAVDLYSTLARAGQTGESVVIAFEHGGSLEIDPMSARAFTKILGKDKINHAATKGRESLMDAFSEAAMDKRFSGHF